VRAPLLACAALALAAPSLAHADRIKVAVVPGIAVNLDAARVDVLGQDLATALTAELDLDAIGGLEVRRQLPVEGLAPDCVAQPKCIADVAQRLGANQLLFVVMVDTGTGGAIQVDSTWVDAATGKSQSRPAVDIASIADAVSRFKASAQQLLPDAPVRPKPKTGSQIGKMSDVVPRHVTRPAMITAGVGAVGLGLGIAFGISARSRYKDCEAQVKNEFVACTQSQRDSIRNRDAFADAGFAVAIGGAVATVVLYMTSGKESHLIVEPTANGAAAAWVGRF
jgi:hypothetical protein